MRFCCVSYLLLRHHHTNLGFIILDKFARDVGDHLLDGSGELEGNLVLLSDCLTKTVTTAQTLNAEGDRHRGRELGIADPFAVDVELAASTGILQ